MFTLHGFHLYNIETFPSTYPNALPHCSAATAHSSKIYDSVTSDRSLVTIQESTFSVSFLLCFTMVLSIFSSEQTILVLFDGAQGALNLHATPFFFLQVVI